MRVLIADDHELLCDALEKLIRDDNPENHVVSVRTLQAAGVALSEEPFDLALIDFYMPGVNGIEGLVALQRQHPDTRLILISSGLATTDIFRAIGDGLAGFIPKASISGRGFLAALKLVLSGETYLPATVVQRASAIQERFSQREFRIIQRIRAGSTNKEIAIALALDENTVKTALRGIAAKLKARNRTEIALKASELDLANEV